MRAVLVWFATIFGALYFTRAAVLALIAGDLLWAAICTVVASVNVQPVVVLLLNVTVRWLEKLAAWSEGKQARLELELARRQEERQRQQEQQP